MILQNNKQKAFTIVELLIVIVVIGILAAISIVAYNGIQNRARNTAVADSAAQVRSKIETWSSIQGSYPLPADFGTLTSGKVPSGTAALVEGNAQEAEIPADVASKLYIAGAVPTSGIPTNHSGASPIHVFACADGAEITYFQTDGNETINIGDGC